MNGVERIATERQRQIESEGWTPEHDDGHDLGELATAAACYALPDVAEEWWPWAWKWWKPQADASQSGPERVRELEKAGALIAAEIDRVLREERDDRP